MPKAPTRMAQAYHPRPRPTGRRVIAITDMKLANPNPISSATPWPSTRWPPRADAGHGRPPQDRVYAIAPGAMLPVLTSSTAATRDSGRMNLLRRLTDPAEIAEPRSSGEGHLASGETLFVDSGQHLLSPSRATAVSGPRLIPACPGGSAC
jgi:hypothetical protein